MAVYVDDMKAKYGRMVMCHMLADTDLELHQMADRIGVARRWHQRRGTPYSHYDICLAKRALAVANGAKEITMREAGMICRRRRLNLPANTLLTKPRGVMQWNGANTTGTT